MTATPEERASELVSVTDSALKAAALSRPEHYSFVSGFLAMMEPAIAQAIREAEDAAISKVLASLREPHGHLIPAVLQALDQMAKKD